MRQVCVSTIRTMADIGWAIREARVERGLTQAQLARSAKVSVPWLSQVERGKVAADFQRILDVADTLGCEITFTATEQS
jgi:HTH-type transcriptional regulator/antitoxin HipB